MRKGDTLKFRAPRYDAGPRVEFRRAQYELPPMGSAHAAAPSDDVAWVARQLERAIAGAMAESVKPSALADIADAIGPSVQVIRKRTRDPRVQKLASGLRSDAANVAEFGVDTTGMATKLGASEAKVLGNIGKKTGKIAVKSVIRALVFNMPPDEVKSYETACEWFGEEYFPRFVAQARRERRRRALAGDLASDLVAGKAALRAAAPVQAAEDDGELAAMLRNSPLLARAKDEAQAAILRRRQSIEPDEIADAEWDDDAADELPPPPPPPRDDEPAAVIAEKLIESMSLPQVPVALPAVPPPLPARPPESATEIKVAAQESVVAAKLMQAAAAELENTAVQQQQTATLTAIRADQLERAGVIPATKPVSAARAAEIAAVRNLPANATISDALVAGGVPAELVTGATGAAQAVGKNIDLGAVFGAVGQTGGKKKLSDLFNTLRGLGKEAGAAKSGSGEGFAGTLEKGSKYATVGVKGLGAVTKTWLDTILPIFTMVMKQAASVLSSEEFSKLFSSVVSSVAQGASVAVVEGVKTAITADSADRPAPRAAYSNLSIREAARLICGIELTAGDAARIARILQCRANKRESAMHPVVSTHRAIDYGRAAGQYALGFDLDRQMNVAHAMATMLQAVLDQLHRKSRTLPATLHMHVTTGLRGEHALFNASAEGEAGVGKAVRALEQMSDAEIYEEVACMNRMQQVNALLMLSSGLALMTRTAPNTRKALDGHSVFGHALLTVL